MVENKSQIDGIRISVCMATYNGETFLKKQLKSILGQLEDNDELIIQDDASTDGTLAVIRSIKDNRINLDVNQVNVGYIKNFQKAIERSSGEYIFLSDQDDVWPNGRVKTCLNHFFGNAVLIGDAVVIDEAGSILSNSYFELRGGFKNSKVSNIIKSKYLGCCICFRKELLREILPFPNKLFAIPHDYWIGTYSFMFYSPKIVDRAITYYRRHSKNVSNGGGDSKNTIIFQAYYRMATIVLALIRRFKVKYV